MGPGALWGLQPPGPPLKLRAGARFDPQGLFDFCEDQAVHGGMDRKWFPDFVRVVDEKTVMIPDRRGNNRIDSMRNLVRDPRISLLFLIPGVNETLRINGRAEIVVDPELCASFEMQGKLPRAVLVVTVDRIYFQCQKALVRSRLWDVEAQFPRSELPSTGEILEALSKDGFDGAEYDRSYPGHLKKTIY